MGASMYQLGHRPDNRAEESASLGAPSQIVARASLTAEWRDWRHLDEYVADQSSTSTCVAQSASMAVYLRGQTAQLRGEGPAVKRPSVLHGYLLGLLEDQRLDGIPVEDRKIVDAGMRARSLLLAWSRYGIASEEYLPFDPAFLKQVVEAPNAEEQSKLLPFDIDVAAADAKLTGWERIDDSRRSESIALALDVAHFSIVPVKVFDNFMGWTGTATYEGPHGEYRGNHAMCSVGFRPGETCLKNSWGSSWGSEGYVWVKNEFIDTYGLDCWTVTASPQLH